MEEGKTFYIYQGNNLNVETSNIPCCLMFVFLDSTTYLIFINFLTPTHYLDLIKVHQKVGKFAKIAQNFALSMQKSTLA